MKCKNIAGALGVIIALSACSHNDAELADGEVARIGGESLTDADIRAVTPAGLAEVDSVAFVDAYVNSWVADRLILHEAARLIKDTDEIDRLTEQYRRDLIMWEYRTLAVNADPELQLTDDDIKAYYEAHPGQMKLDAPMVRGIYLKLESDDPALRTVRQLYASPNQDNVDRLEKVGLKSAVHYDYFRDTWVPARQVITKIPAELSPSDLHKGLKYEVERDGFTYLLSISDVLPIGATMPLEAAEPRIRETLDAMRRTELDARLVARLRAEAVAGGRLLLR
ncbi:MAG: peptidylprolyl isomerase [Bacteroides sp.]|nr:peptidylprolyl isomerase [Bacteroides sp.]